MRKCKTIQKQTAAHIDSQSDHTQMQANPRLNQKKQRATIQLQRRQQYKRKLENNQRFLKLPKTYYKKTALRIHSQDHHNQANKYDKEI